MKALRIPSEILSDLRDWALQAYPAEACGLLIGTVEGSSDEIREAIVSPNRSSSPDGFELDPQVMLESEISARARDLRVLGVWHSHPDRPSEPSQTDRILAWPGWTYAILSVSPAGGGELRCWRLVEEAFREVDLEEM